MQKFRNHSSFKWLTLILGVCALAFAFHFAVHLGHSDEALDGCPACHAAAFFTLLVFLFFSITRPSGWKACFVDEAFRLPDEPFLLSRAGRAPPLFS